MAALTFSHRQRLTLVATSVGLFMIYLDATIVNVALPDIQNEFDAGEQGLQWVVAAYSLTMGMFIMSAATLADRRGRRKVYIGGMVIFAVASAICAAAPSLFILNLGRGLQGVGAATVNVASLALVSAAFPNPKRKARAIGLWTGIAAVGLAIGPTVGGFLTETAGWRTIFLVNVGVGAVGTLTYALIEGPHTGWLSPLILGLLVVSGLLAVAFVAAELRSPDPMMDVRVFRDPVYSAAIFTLFAILFSVYGMLLVITQYFQNIRDYSPERAGVVMLAFTVPTIILSPISGGIAARAGGRRPTLIGLCLLLAGLIVIVAGVGGPIVVVLIGLVLVGTAGGLALAPTTNVAMSSIPPDRAGMASGIMSAQRALGSTAGFAIMGSVLAAVVGASLPGKFAPFLEEPARQQAIDVVVDNANPRAVASIIGPGRPLPDAVAARTELIDAADDAFVAGIRAALLVGGGLTVAALIAGTIAFPKGTRDEDDEDAEAATLQVEEEVP